MTREHGWSGKETSGNAKICTCKHHISSESDPDESTELQNQVQSSLTLRTVNKPAKLTEPQLGRPKEEEPDRHQADPHSLRQEKRSGLSIRRSFSPEVTRKGGIEGTIHHL